MLNDRAARMLRGARGVCWILLALTAAASIVCAMLFGPRFGLPKVSEDGTLLILSGLVISVLAVPTLLGVVPALLLIRPTSPRLFAATLFASAILVCYVAVAAASLHGLVGGV